jgi:hypothetical protein
VNIFAPEVVGKEIFAGCEAGIGERGFRVPSNSSPHWVVVVMVSFVCE